jgi:hypothetical protein
MGNPKGRKRSEGIAYICIHSYACHCPSYMDSPSAALIPGTGVEMQFNKALTLQDFLNFISKES